VCFVEPFLVENCNIFQMLGPLEWKGTSESSDDNHGFDQADSGSSGPNEN